MTDFGSDMSGDTDLSPTLQDVSGLDLMRQVVCRRLYTPNASLLSAPDEVTCDLREFIGSTQPRDSRLLNGIRATATAALLADPRINSVVIVIDWEPDANFMSVAVSGVGSEGPFELTLAVTAVTIKVLQ